MSSFKIKPTKPTKPTFVSFIAPNGSTNHDHLKESQFYVPLDENIETGMDVNLLPGEIQISQAEKVTQFVPYSNENSGHIGTLFVTNFKVSFVTIVTDGLSDADKHLGRRNRLIGADDVALTNINEIYQVTKGRKKKLLRGSLLEGSIELHCLELHCKDFRIQSYCFSSSDRSQVKQLVNAILHHSFPSRLDLLFGVSFQSSNHQPHETDSKVPDFFAPRSWQDELERLNVQGFRLSQCNSQYTLTSSLPEYFVVPLSLLDEVIKKSSAETTKRCIPLWSYTYTNGCSLVRLAYGNLAEFTEVIIGLVRESHPKSRKPELIDLGSGKLPSIQDLQTSYERLRELCMPSTNKDLWSSDVTWYSALETCQWLNYVRLTVSVAHDVVQKMSFDSRSVIIREKDGIDYSPVISCLSQLMLDPFSRTIQGFQSLIEREWVALGHKFNDRCAIVYNKNSEQGPFFLLFLDCVWQLLQQFPSSFEFSEIYLTSLWDSVGLAMFRNFVLNCPAPSGQMSPRIAQQYAPSYASKSLLLSVWDWTNQFSYDDVLLFTNPLYVARQMVDEKRRADVAFDVLYKNFSENDRTTRSGSLSPKQTIDARRLYRLQNNAAATDGDDVLRPVAKAPHVRLWEHCYLRWLTPIQIVGGGMPCEYIAQSMLLEDVKTLEDEIRNVESTILRKSETTTTDGKAPKVTTDDRRKMTTIKMPSISKSHLSDRVSSSYPYSPTRPPNWSMFLMMPMMPPPQQRTSSSSYNDDSFSIDDFTVNDRSGGSNY